MFLNIFLNFISCLLVKRGGSLSFLTVLHFCRSKVIGLDMTEKRMFILCRMITWVVFFRMFWNFISSLPVKRVWSLSFLVGTISNVLVMEIDWTDVGSGGYILVSCAHSNTSFVCFTVVLFRMFHCCFISYVSLLLFYFVCFTVILLRMFHCYFISYVSLLFYFVCFTVILIHMFHSYCFVSLNCVFVMSTTKAVSLIVDITEILLKVALNTINHKLSLIVVHSLNRCHFII